jgi:hypothetical protein
VRALLFPDPPTWQCGEDAADRHSPMGRAS